MNINILTFALNNHEKFIINLDKLDDIIHCCYLSNVSLFINKEEIIIGKSIIIDLIEGLKNKLALALSNELKLHASIESYIGYYYNQYSNEENPNLFFKLGCNDREAKSWVGLIYLLWTTDSNIKYQQYATWIYNDVYGNIIFEVTPIYPEGYVDQEDPAEVQAYQEWMETSYKPFFTRIIPMDVAIQWLDQANLILKTIDENTKMLQAQYEAKNKDEDINLK